MWALWGTRMLPTISAVFFSRSTEERIGRGFSIWDRRSEFPIWRFALLRPQIVFAGAWHTHRPPWSTYAPIDGPGSGLYRSQDAGKTWTRLVGNGLPDGDWGRVGVAVAPDGKRVYALISIQAQTKTQPQVKMQTPPQMQAAGHATEPTGVDRSGLYRSDDGGNNWVLANADPRLTERAWYFSGVTIDPQNSDVVYMPNVALYRSEDGGKTISIVRGAPGGDDYHQIWVDPANSASMVLGTDQGTTISLDRGKTWSSWYNQPTAQLYHVTTDNQFPYTSMARSRIATRLRSRAAPAMVRSRLAIGLPRARAKADT
jgi:hypothetical protein